MARLTTVRVMISSRSKQRFPYKSNDNAQLSDVRKDLAGIIEKEELFGEPLFEPWINELAPAAEGTEDIWDKCLDEVNRAELVISLYNGDAGWAKAGGEIGICHAELNEGYAKAPAKVRILQLTPLAPRRKGPDGKRDDLFRDYVEKLHRFTGEPCENGEQVIELCRRTLREAVGDMVKLGVREARKGKFYSGDALDWSHLDFRARQRAMVQVVLRALERRGGSTVGKQGYAISVPIQGREVVVLCSAISGPYAFAEAREGVSQLFLRDYEHALELGQSLFGPVHLVACHRSATEGQAVRQLGFPDATVVSTPFGVYVADKIQKIQLVFLSNCRDPTTTMYQVQRLFDWIEEVGEGPLIVERAESRARIVIAIAGENKSASKHT
jgi:hypothetical protein